MDAPAELVTQPCPECGKEFTGKARGPGNVAMKIGGHRYREHGYRNPDAKKSHKKKRTTDDDATPVLAVVHDMADEIGKGKRPPTADELAGALGKGLSVASVAVASYFAETDPTIAVGIEGDKDRDDLVDYLSLPPAHARNVMSPVGRLIATTPLNKRYGRTIVENVDVVESIGEVGKLVLHWRRYMHLRSEAVAGQRPAQPMASFVVPPPQTTPNNGNTPLISVPPGPQDGSVTDQMAGKLVTPDDLLGLN
jgi:hypothetical protein